MKTELTGKVTGGSWASFTFECPCGAEIETLADYSEVECPDCGLAYDVLVTATARREPEGALALRKFMVQLRQYSGLDGINMEHIRKAFDQLSTNELRSIPDYLAKSQ